jgi:SAM-dependent methyltransferase
MMADEDEVPQNGSPAAEEQESDASSAEQKLEPPPKPKGRRARSITSPQTPVARSSTPAPAEDSESDPAAPAATALKAPRAPSFTPPPTPFQVSVREEIDVELDLSPEALHTEARSQSESARPPPPPSRSGPPMRPLSARPISVPPRPPSARSVSDPPRPPSARPASEPPRAGSEPPRAGPEPPRAGSEPPRAGSEPPRAGSEPPRPASDRAQAAAAAPSSPPERDSEPPRISEPPVSEPPAIPAVDAEPDSPAPIAAELTPASGQEPASLARRARMITIPDDQVPQQREGSDSRSAISAMRIINVGAATDDDIPLEVVMESTEAASEEPSEARGKLDSAEELSDDDVAPDSEEATQKSDGAAARVPSDRAPAGKPPPPPRRPLPPARERQPTLTGIESEPKRRPWWEEVFGEDYVRAASRLADKQIAHEVDFIERSLGVAPGGVVLDLGCGAGHHAVELASRGYGVVGYDLSLYQLALAADVAQEKGQKLNFLQGDMREMAFEEMFDGVYCWNTTFGYFEEEKNIMVAQRIFRALRPGGMFLLDVANRDFAAAQQPSQVWYEGDACVCMDDMSVDFITSRLRVKRNIILDDGRTRECTYSVRLYTLHELGKILHDVGFRIAEASGHPATPGVFFGTSSPRIIMLAQKP